MQWSLANGHIIIHFHILSIQKIKIRYYVLSSHYQAVSCKLIFTIHLTIVVWALASAGPVLARLTLTLTQAELTGVLSPGLAWPRLTIARTRPARHLQIANLTTRHRSHVISYLANNHTIFQTFKYIKRKRFIRYIICIWKNIIINIMLQLHKHLNLIRFVKKVFCSVEISHHTARTFIYSFSS